MIESISKSNKKKRVKIIQDKYGIDLAITTNGYQWLTLPVSVEVLNMIKDAINQYLEGKHDNSTQE